MTLTENMHEGKTYLFLHFANKLDSILPRGTIKPKNNAFTVFRHQLIPYSGINARDKGCFKGLRHRFTLPRIVLPEERPNPLYKFVVGLYFDDCESST